MRIFALEKLVKKQLKWGVFITQKESARWQLERADLPFRSAGRSIGPTVRFLTIVLSIDRPG